MASTKTEKLSQYAVIFIAITALVVSVWQGYVTQKHNRLTVRPYFNLSTSTNRTPTYNGFNLNLTNQGYGPGIIKKFEITVDGEPQPHWNAVVSKLADQSIMTQAANLNSDDVFAAGKEQVLLSLENYTSQRRIRLKIVYQSIYEEQFEETIDF